MQIKIALVTLALSVVPAMAGERIYPRSRLSARQNNDDPQNSLSLDPSLVQTGSKRTGQEDPTAGQVESLTSNNNFINFCDRFPDVPLTNGEQIFEGSCNGIPMGRIMAKDKMPSQKILNPKNGDSIPEGQDISFQIKVKNMQTGSFTNAQLTYYSAPQQLNDQGILIAHSHITVDEIKSLDDTDPSDPQDFVFFKGLNDPDVNGVLNATAVGGLKAGFYRACSLGSGANHMPIIPPVAQRAAMDDCIRFTVTAAGGNNANAGANGGQQQGNNGGQQQGNNGGNGGQQQGNNGGNGQGRNGQGRNGRNRNNNKRSNFRRSFSPSGRSRVARF